MCEAVFTLLAQLPTAKLEARISHTQSILERGVDWTFKCSRGAARQALFSSALIPYPWLTSLAALMVTTLRSMTM